MIKKLEVTDRVGYAARVMFPPLSESELSLLKILIDYSSQNTITLSADLSRQIIAATGLKETTFNVSLHRLEKKGVIRSTGKTKTLHPIFKDINECKGLLISFV